MKTLIRLRVGTLVLSAALAALLAMASVSVRADENATRPQQALLDGWKFHRGAAEHADEVGFDDASWTSVTLPHTWNAEDGQDGGGNYFRGDGWYRRHFRVPAAWAGKQVYLQFDGANRSAEVFLNGRRLGLHRGGFARFRFDVTQAIVLDGDNLVAVRVNNGEHDNIAPLLGDFTLFGGLYRGVSLFATERVQIETLDRASDGVFVRAEKVTPELAELDVKVELANHNAAACNAEVRISVLEGDGRNVQTVPIASSLAANAGGVVAHRVELVQPHLWDGLADPYLYRIRVEVRAGGAVRDVVEQTFGVRFFGLDPAKGFSLNGRPLELRGANRHQDRFGRGWAIGAAEDREDMALMLEMGANMDRTSHYQQSQLWYELADRAGMVLWTEIPLVYDVVDTPELFENAKEQLRELIRQNYNHPSILFWGIGNETFVRDTNVTPPDTNDRLLHQLAAVVREEDPSRLSVYASNGDVSEPRAAHSDAVGFNHYFGWYHDEPEDFVTWLDRQHAARPDLKIGMSEYGAGANPAQHEEPPRHPNAPGPWHPEEWQAHFHEVYWQVLSSRRWVWCKLVWCMFDLASDGRNEGGTPGINDKGLVTFDRKTRKDAFYFYQANWSERPVLHIASRRFTPRTQAVTTVKVYSNAPEVELWVNGVSAGVAKGGGPGNRVFVWNNVRLTAGENRVMARANRAGATLEDQCVWELVKNAAGTAALGRTAAR
jgi:beta-galactosidase